MNNKRKITLFVTALALVAVLVTGATLAYFTDQTERKNIITFGKVDGSMSETGEQEREDGSVGKDYTNILPGQKLDKDPTITLDQNSEDAFARIEITYEGLTDEQIAELEAILPLNAGWKKAADGFYYYKDKLTKTNNTTAIFDNVLIPANWGNSLASKGFSMNVIGQLIQADNFTPVMDADGYISSWGVVTVEESE